MDPNVCAEWHCDRHVVKMILETCQLLCTTWCVLDPDGREFVSPYKKTHVNHPCAKWVRASAANYEWLVALGRALCAEYTHRYWKVHKCKPILDALSDHIPSSLSRTAGFTTPPMAMPDQYKVDVDVVAAYRNYYAFAKAHLHSWKERDVPPFLHALHNDMPTHM